MARRMSIEDRLARIAKLERAPISNDAIKELGKALASANSALVARTAQAAGKLSAIDLAPHLIKAFSRFINNPIKTDRGCLAKNAIIEALDRIDYNDEDIFLKGICYIQKEAVFGGTTDTAAELRGKCGFALARMGYPEARFELAALLMDSESQARIAAARAIASLGGIEGELLLRMKVMAGDQESDVIGECFTGLLSINFERSLSFVSEFLASDNPLMMEAAIFALGESRKKPAFEILRDYRENNIIEPEVHKILLLAIALTRLDEAFEYLIKVIGDEHRKNAIAALEALKIVRVSDDLRVRIDKIVTSHDDETVREAWIY